MRNSPGYRALPRAPRRGLGWRMHESVEDTKLSTNKQHSLALSKQLAAREPQQDASRTIVLNLTQENGRSGRLPVAPSSATPSWVPRDTNCQGRRTLRQKASPAMPRCAITAAKVCDISVDHLD